MRNQEPEYHYDISVTIGKGDIVEICTLCKNFIHEEYYKVQAVLPEENILWFHQSCFEQVIAIGMKIYYELTRPEGKHN